jgi:hypothetical protein
MITLHGYKAKTIINTALFPLPCGERWRGVINLTGQQDNTADKYYAKNLYSFVYCDSRSNDECRNL